MRAKLSRLLRRLGVHQYLRPLYRRFVADPYWRIRARFVPARKSVAGVSASFVVEQPGDRNYHEFTSERPVIDDILESADRDCVFYDIGANIGIYSCFISNGLSGSEVVAFEPSSPAYRRLERNAAFTDGPISCYKVAIGAEDATTSFAVDVVDSTARSSSLQTEELGERYEVQHVRVRRLDTLIEEQGLPQPTILKIDVEGGEFDVLQGMGDVLDEVEILYCELHREELQGFGATVEEVIAYLESHGFTLETIPDAGGNDYIKAVRK